jgi:hypothetical protein
MATGSSRRRALERMMPSAAPVITNPNTKPATHSATAGPASRHDGPTRIAMTKIANGVKAASIKPHPRTPTNRPHHRAGRRVQRFFSDSPTLYCASIRCAHVIPSERNTRIPAYMNRGLRSEKSDTRALAGRR